MGGIPGLANLASAREIKDLVYHNNPGLDNPDGIEPQERFEVPEGVLELPHLYDTVKTLDQVVDVDYYVPGCAARGEAGVGRARGRHGRSGGPRRAAAQGLRHRGEPQDAAATSASASQGREEDPRFQAHREFLPDPEQCLLEQGVICMGPATRAGCGARCTTAGMPCRGCYGAA